MTTRHISRGKSTKLTHFRIYPGRPPDSMWLAMVTSSDHTSNCSLFMLPNTPLSAAPVCTPTRMLTSVPVRFCTSLYKLDFLITANQKSELILHGAIILICSTTIHILHIQNMYIILQSYKWDLLTTANQKSDLILHGAVILTLTYNTHTTYTEHMCIILQFLPSMLFHTRSTHAQNHTNLIASTMARPILTQLTAWFGVSLGIPDTQ